MAPRILFCVLSILGLLAGMVGTTALASAPVAGRAEGASPAPLINPDGTLRLDGTVSGVLDTHGWQVTLDPERGPVFAPQSADPQWRNLGDAPAPAISSSVLAIAVSGNNVYIGGSFTDAGGVPEADYIARWDGTRWHALGSGLNGSVTAIAISGNNVFVGGTFLNAGGVPEADYIARWDGSQWHALGGSSGSGPLQIGSPNPPVAAIAISGADVYVGGSFVNAGGVPEADYIARWNTATQSWHALGGSGGSGPIIPPDSFIYPIVRAIAVSGNDVYIGGHFTDAGGLANADNIARWDRAAQSWNALGGGLNAGVYAIAVSGSDVYVGGDFTNAGGTISANIARWDGATWNALGEKLPQGPVFAIAVTPDSVYAGGSFPQIGNLETASYVARWNPATASWSSLGTTIKNALNERVNAIVVHRTGVYVGGDFTNAGGVPEADYVARWDGTRWHALGGSNGRGPLQRLWWINQTPVSALAMIGDDLYVGGMFNNAGDVAEADHIARWNVATQSWHALGGSSGNGPLQPPSSFTPPSVSALAVSGNDLYVGGDFLDAGGAPEADYIARWNTATQSWHALGGSGGNGPLTLHRFTPAVAAIAISGNDVYIGGNFINAGGVPEADYVARWNAATQSWHALGSGLRGPVFAIAASGSDVYVGGGFTDAGGVPEADYITRWDGTRWHALGGSNGNGPLQPFGGPIVRVHAIAISGNDVYIGGIFGNAGGVPEADCIARWDGTRWHALGGTSEHGPLLPMLDFPRSPVQTLVINENDLYIGGLFRDAGGVALADYAAVYATPPTVAAITRLGASPTSAATVAYRVTFSEAVTGVEASDFSLTTTGVISGAEVASVIGAGTTYTVTVNTGVGNGTLRLDIPASASITDLPGLTLIGLPYTSGETYDILKERRVYLPVVVR
ncbi:MAG: Ig-like domain-containing protein [Roseiflexus sp.]|nr:Ig-like domain-containing protein [Roseiflexus sp.]